MKKTIFFTVLAMLLTYPIFSQNTSGLIDFENGTYIGTSNYPGIHTPVDNNPGGVDNAYFSAVYGVKFTCVDDLGNFVGLPRYAQVGGPMTAFGSVTGATTPYTTAKGGSSCVGYTGNSDHPHNTQLDEGCYFLTDEDGVVKPEPNTLRVDYNLEIESCTYASGYLLDVDGQEAFHIRAYTNGNFTIPEEEILLVSPDYNAGISGPLPNVPIFSDANNPTGNALPAYWEVNTNNYIERIEIDYVGNSSSNVGIAFDEFSYCSSSNCSVDAKFHLINENDGSGRIRTFDQSSTNSISTIVSRTWTVETIETDRIYYPGGTTFDYRVPIADHYLICLETIAINEATGECCKDRHCEWLFIEVSEETCFMDPSFTYNCFSDDCIFQFNGSQGNSNRNVRSWYWSFGDGSSSFDQRPIHTYSSPGQYEICLTITGETGTDGECCTETACRTINFNCQGIDFIEICDHQPDNPGPNTPGGMIEQPDNTIESQRPALEQAPDKMILAPNPVTNTSVLSFSFDEAQKNVRLLLIEAASGKQQLLMNNAQMSKGQHSVFIDGNTLNAGTYILQLQTDKENQSLRMVNLANQ